MRSLFLFVFLITGLVVQGCSTVAVKSDFSPDYDFSVLKSFRWLEESPSSSNDTRVENEAVREAVVNGVDRELKKKGYSRVDSDRKADFMVAWHGAVNRRLQQQSLDHFYGPYGYGPVARAAAEKEGAGVGNVREYEEGVLVIDILDPTGKTIVWRGSGKQELAPKPLADEVRREINRAVATILNRFPPDTK
ncbi:MAG: DUF4136 domain-containing protein [Thermodesulfobacteriota bacterium]